MSSPAVWAGLAARIAAAATRTGRAASREFSIEGTRLFERALRSAAPVKDALVSARYGAKAREREVLALLDAQGVTVQVVPDEVAEELTGGRTFGTILGLVELCSKDNSLPTEGDLLVAVDVQDPGNVGALIRTAAASGAAALIAVGTTDAYHPKAVRTSMGSLFKLSIIEFSNSDEVLRELHAAGHTSLAAVPRGGLAPWSEDLLGAPHAVFVGSEAHGLSDYVQSACDARVSLPQRDDLDSYSVNAAAAMLLYELARRRATH